MGKEQLLAIIREKHPSSVRALRGCLKEMNLDIPDADLIALVGQLSAEGRVSLQIPSESSSFSGYLTDLSRSGWVYVLLSLALVETLLVESGAKNEFLGFFRLTLGLALLGFTPGYSALRLVFPKGGFGLLEQIILSVFLSLLISIFSGTLLGSVNALGATSNVLLLAVFTFVLTIAAAYRRFEFSSREK